MDRHGFFESLEVLGMTNNATPMELFLMGSLFLVGSNGTSTSTNHRQIGAFDVQKPPVIPFCWLVKNWDSHTNDYGCVFKKHIR